MLCACLLLDTILYTNLIAGLLSVCSYGINVMALFMYIVGKKEEVRAFTKL